MGTFTGIRSPPRTFFVSLSSCFFLFRLPQSRQCLFEVRSALHWRSIGTCFVRTKPPITFYDTNILVGSNGGLAVKYSLSPGFHHIGVREVFFFLDDVLKE